MVGAIVGGLIGLVAAILSTAFYFGTLSEKIENIDRSISRNKEDLSQEIIENRISILVFSQRINKSDLKRLIYKIDRLSPDSPAHESMNNEKISLEIIRDGLQSKLDPLYRKIPKLRGG